MSRQKRRPVAYELLTDARDPGEILRQAAEAASVLEPGGPETDGIDRAESFIADRLRRILELAAPFDAFDLIELVRMAQSPLSLDGFKESENTATPAAVELVVILLLSRGSRSPSRPAQADEQRPAAIVEDVLQAANEVLAAAAHLLVAETARLKHPLAALAAQYRATELRVRVRQYASVQAAVERELFQDRDVAKRLRAEIGFDYDDVVAVRRAIGDEWSASRTKLLEGMQRLVAGTSAEPSQAEAEQLRTVWDALFEHPAATSTVTVAAIAARSGLPAEVCERIVVELSLPFLATDPTGAAHRFLSGENPLLSRNLIRDERGYYLPSGGDLAVDGLRPVLEAALKRSSLQAYQNHRGRISERIAVDCLATALSPDVTHRSLEYLTPRKEFDVVDLGPDAADPRTAGDQTEADGLLIVDGVAICVEVKGRPISEGSRQGSVRKLATDLEKTVGEARNQAARLTALIETNRGLWRPDGTWLDLSHVKEVHAVAVTLEDLSSLGCSLDALVRARVLPPEGVPWVVSLHDLNVTTTILDRAEELLLFLRRRTDVEIARRYEATDELDLVMLFVRGRLWVDPDPDMIYQRYPTSDRPKATARQKYRSQAAITRVHTWTDTLDAWMTFQEGSSDAPANKPEFAGRGDPVDRLVQTLVAARGSGWLRMSADLLNLGEEARDRFADAMAAMLERSRADGDRHTFFDSMASQWGYSCVALGTPAMGNSVDQEFDRLYRYARAKKYQLRAERCLVLLVNRRGAPLRQALLDGVEQHSAEMDASVAAMRLLPPPSGGAKLPPRARRATARLRGKRSR